MRGYGGRILFVDAGTGRDARRAGAGRSARGAPRRQRPRRAPPRSTTPRRASTLTIAANAVVFAVGPVTDTTVPGNSRACVAAKSPLTGLFFDSTFGGRFPATMKRTGFDAIVHHRPRAGAVVRARDRGRAPSSARARPLGPDARATPCTPCRRSKAPTPDVMAIGPAGEHRVRFACHRHLLEEPRGRGRAAAASARCWAPRTSRRSSVAGARKTEMADARRAQGADRRAARAADRPGPRRCPPGARRSSSSPSTRWARSAPTTCARRSFADARGHFRRGDARPLPRPGHDVPQVPGGVRQAVRDPRRRAGRAQGEDARVRDDLRVRLHARQRARGLAHARQRPLRPPRAWTRSPWA